MEFNPLNRGEEKELEEKGREIIKNLERKTKKNKDQENVEKANFIMKSLKKRSKEEFDIEGLSEEQITKSLKTNDGRSLVIKREKKNK